MVIDKPIVETESENESIVTIETPIETPKNIEEKVVATKKATVQNSAVSEKTAPNSTEVAFQAEVVNLTEKNNTVKNIPTKKYISAQSLLTQVESEKNNRTKNRT